MMISSRGRYALRVMVDLAENGGETALLPLSGVSSRLCLSRKYLESVMNALVKAELVTSHPGKAGGYRLSRPASSYTAWEILSLAEGGLCPVSCVLEDCDDACPDRDSCPTVPLWEGLDKAIKDYLSSVTLADMIR